MTECGDAATGTVLCASSFDVLLSLMSVADDRSPVVKFTCSLGVVKRRFAKGGSWAVRIKGRNGKPGAKPSLEITCQDSCASLYESVDRIIKSYEDSRGAFGRR